MATLTIEFRTVEGLKQELLRLISDLKASTKASPTIEPEYVPGLDDEKAVVAETYEQAKAITAEPVAKAPAVSIEEVRALGAKLRDAGKAPADVIKRHGGKLSEMSPDVLATVYAELQAL